MSHGNLFLMNLGSTSQPINSNNNEVPTTHSLRKGNNNRVSSHSNHQELVRHQTHHYELCVHHICQPLRKVNNNRVSSHSNHQELVGHL